MEKYFALIKNNLVHSVIVADDDFIEHIKNDYEFIIDVTENRPQPGDSYYSKTNSFVANHIEINEIPATEEIDELTFKPFKLSKYTVHHEAGYIVIGCKKYSAAGFIQALIDIVENDLDTTSHFTTENGPGHGKFKITWGDTQKLYNVIVKGEEE